MKSQDSNFPHTSLSTRQFKIRLRAKGETQPRHSRLFLLDRTLLHSHQLWKWCLLVAGFSTGERRFRRQEQHDPNGLHLGEKIALFVYTTAEQWVIASGGPNQNGSNEKFSTLQWDAELEKKSWKFWRIRFWVPGRDGEQFVLMGLEKQKAGTEADWQTWPVSTQPKWRVSWIKSSSNNDALQWTMSINLSLWWASECEANACFRFTACLLITSFSTLCNYSTIYMFNMTYFCLLKPASSLILPKSDIFQIYTLYTLLLPAAITQYKILHYKSIPTSLKLFLASTDFPIITSVQCISLDYSIIHFKGVFVYSTSVPITREWVVNDIE